MTLLRVSLLKLVRRPASWVVIVVLLGLIALVFVGVAASIGQIDDPVEQAQLRRILTFPDAYTALAGIVLSFGGLLAVVYGAAIIGGEWAWGTIRAVVARGESRIRFTLVTFLAIAILVAVGVALAFAVGVVVAVLAADMAGLDTAGATDLAALASFPELVTRSWLGVSEQAAIGFAIAMLFRSQLAGIGAGLALYFGEIFLALVPLTADVLPYFPFNVATSVVSSAGSLGLEGSDVGRLHSGLALGLASLYLVAAVAVAALAAWRAQITR